MLRISNLVTHFHTPAGVVPAVDGVSFAVAPGQTLCLVGESGCGKSVTALSIMRLVAQPAGRIEGGTIEFDGDNLLDYSERRMRDVRGARIGMIFQEPMTSLNPVFRVGRQVAEALLTHKIVRGKAEAQNRTIELFHRVGIPAPADKFRAYPHELSGGLRQRVMIAMAISCGPSLLIADEPTTALDVTIQAQILALLNELKDELGMSTIFITHDLGVVAEMADDVAVMYAGQIIEYAPVKRIFDAPQHPYTRGLLDSVPNLERLEPGAKREPLKAIPGSVPRLVGGAPHGCRFADRCAYVEDKCRANNQVLDEVQSGHQVACWKRPL